MWHYKYYPRVALSTEQAAIRELTDTSEGGVSERAYRIAENSAEAVARLVAVLQDKCVLHESEVQKILNLYGYEWKD